MGSEFVESKLGAAKRVQERARGGRRKLKLLSGDLANVTDPKTGQTKPSKILTVIENPADPHFIRRNVLTKGAIIETELGKARVTSRPGQMGIVNALLIEPRKVPEEKPPEERPPEEKAPEPEKS
jgi:small subunit ribosomal protein S8e